MTDKNVDCGYYDNPGLPKGWHDLSQNAPPPQPSWMSDSDYRDLCNNKGSEMAKANGYDAQGNKLGGVRLYSVHGNDIDKGTAFNVKGNCRRSVNVVNGELEAHSTDDKVNRSRPEHHAENAYNGKQVDHNSSRAEKEAAGYYQVENGNWRRK